MVRYAGAILRRARESLLDAPELPRAGYRFARDAYVFLRDGDAFTRCSLAFVLDSDAFARRGG